jgi:hypothetical protein
LEELVSGLLRPKLFPFGKLSKAKPAAQAIRFLIANKCTRWRGIFEGLLQNGVRAESAENLRTSSFDEGLSVDTGTTFSQIYLDGQYL